MSNNSHIHVRNLEVGDFDFVRDLASQQPNFTVPPPYVLWLLLRIKGAITLIAEDSHEGPVSYLLAVPVETPENCLYIWQLATKETSHQSDFTVALLAHLRGLLSHSHLQLVAFSAIPDSPAFRAFRLYAVRFGASVPTPAARLPQSVEAQEGEYHVRI